MKRLLVVLVAGLILQGSSASSAASAQRLEGGRQSRIVLLVDSSTRMSSMLNPFRSALKAFLDTLPGDPEVMIVSMGGQLRVRVGPTTDRAALLDAAGRLSSDGGGNMLVDTLLEADKRFLQTVPTMRSILVVMTTDADSGMNDASAARYNAFLLDYLNRGGRAHGVVLQGSSMGVARHVVENLTKNSGGFYETVLVATALPKVMTTLAQYVAADL